VNGKLQPVLEEVETVRRPFHPSLPKEHQHNCDSSSEDSSYSSNSESSEEDDDDEGNVFAWMGRTKKAKNRKVAEKSKGKQLATDPPLRSGNDDGSMKRINRSGVITPISTVQKNKRDRNSSSTILSSSTTMSTKMKGKAKRASGDDDGGDDDYGVVDNGSMKKRKAKRARRDDDDDDEEDDNEKEEEEQETAPTGSIHAVWTPELVRRCILCSN
jgi:hypothetical protein